MVPMILTVAGNAAFGAMIWAFYRYTGGDMTRFIPGLAFASATLFCGLILGVIGSQPKKTKSTSRKSVPAATASIDWDLSAITE